MTAKARQLWMSEVKKLLVEGVDQEWSLTRYGSTLSRVNELGG